MVSVTRLAMAECVWNTGHSPRRRSDVSAEDELRSETSDTNFLSISMVASGRASRC